MFQGTLVLCLGFVEGLGFWSQAPGFRAAPNRNGVALDCTPHRDAAQWREQAFSFYDARLLDGAWLDQPCAALAKQFFRVLAICHTVIPDGEQPGPLGGTHCTSSRE
jgi:hypothetical protein